MDVSVTCDLPAPSPPSLTFGTQTSPNKKRGEGGTQVNFAEVMALHEALNEAVRKAGEGAGVRRESVNLNGSGAEVSSVESQTDETLETYKILAKLIEQWVSEVEDSTMRAERAEDQVKVLTHQISELHRSFQNLRRVATECRKEWRRREAALTKKHDETKAHYRTLMSNVWRKITNLEGEVDEEQKLAWPPF
jgi:uncharacterized protein HemX